MFYNAYKSHHGEFKRGQIVRISIQLTEEQFQVLKALATDKKVSLSELIRRNLEKTIVSSIDKTPSGRREGAIAIAGRFRSGNPNARASEEHDAYLTDIYSS